MRAAELHLDLHAHGARHTIAPAGELDMSTAPELHAVVARVCIDGARELILDLRGLTFIDSTGLRVILTSRELCASNQCDFMLIPGRRSVQRVFELTGLLERLPFRETEADPSRGEQADPAGFG